MQLRSPFSNSGCKPFVIHILDVASISYAGVVCMQINALLKLSEKFLFYISETHRLCSSNSTLLTHSKKMYLNS